MYADMVMYQGDDDDEEEDGYDASLDTEDCKPPAVLSSKEAMKEKGDESSPTTKAKRSDSTDANIFCTPDGDLLLKHPNGTPIAVIGSDSTDVAALFRNGAFRVTSLLDSDGKTNASAVLHNCGFDSVTSSGRKYQRWTEEEDDLLREAIDKHVGGPPYNWKRISRKYFKCFRTASQCKNRWKKVSQVKCRACFESEWLQANPLSSPYCSQCLMPGLKRSPFTKEEDEIIIKHAEQKTWPEISRLLPGRISEQIRERWTNCLDPSLTKEPWTKEEVEKLFQAQAKFGNQWVKISKLLPGRSENSCKNRWHNAKMSQRRKVKSIAKKANVAETLKAARSHTDESNMDTKDE